MPEGKPRQSSSQVVGVMEITVIKPGSCRPWVKRKRAALTAASPARGTVVVIVAVIVAGDDQYVGIRCQDIVHKPCIQDIV